MIQLKVNSNSSIFPSVTKLSLQHCTVIIKLSIKRSEKILTGYTPNKVEMRAWMS